MTSKGDSLKTNELLRLRKLRLQQVREQSKDIAKKVRQRAKVEQLRHVTTVDSNKEKIYLQQQEQLVNRLEQLYSQGLKNVGAGHKNASEINKDIPEKKDLSKLRGKEAVAELRRKKQEKLDEQKKFLDRKLHAREAANELSREKSVAIANTLTKSSSGKSVHEALKKGSETNKKVSSEINENEGHQKDKPDTVTKNDMGTQWDFEEIPNEWESDIPALSLPKEDSIKNFESENVEKTDKNKRLNLFALSDEMPSSLRGGMTSIPEERLPTKPSLTLVSEYLQNRGLRLREPNTIPQKKNVEDLQNIKQTLLKTRASRTDGSVSSNICHVLDKQVIPVPCWRAENHCEFCTQRNKFPLCHKSKKLLHNSSPRVRSDLPDLFLSFESLEPFTGFHYDKCYHRHKFSVTGRSDNIEHSNKSTEHHSALNKKNSVTMYDHNTRDIRNLPHNIERLVVRDCNENNDEDAYSQAFKEASIADKDMTQHKKQQENRNRIAMTKQSVDKEYRDTLAFLNSLPKEKPARSIRTAYMDGDRQQELKDRHQHKMQQEYRKIEKECSRRHCKHSKRNTGATDQNRSKSKSPNKNVISRDFQYSWLPVPESDASLAIHTVPNTAKDRPGNSVKFSSVDTYHEYRSRHKHTPPTKDNEPHKKVVEAVIIQDNGNDSTNSSYETDTSSVDNLQVNSDNSVHNRKDRNEQLNDAERIIIYKVVESNKDNKHKRHRAKEKTVPTCKVNEEQNDNVSMRNINIGHQKEDASHTDKVTANSVTFSQVKEGVFKTVSADGDNIASMYFSDDQLENRCNQHKIPHDKGPNTVSEDGDNSLNRTTKPCGICKSTGKHQHSDKQASAATSTSSFKTAFDKANNVVTDGGFVKFVNEGGEETGKFYVGASGFLKDDAYEVVIQLRKKEAERHILQPQDKDIVHINTPIDKGVEKHDIGQQSNIILPPNTKVNRISILNDDVLVKSPEKVKSSASVPTQDDIPQQPLLCKENKCAQMELNNNSKPNLSDTEPPKLIDKAAGTSFQDTFAIVDNAPKLDPISRPAASTYTQTTHESPIPRPVLMHLSSSTSTTYMSPPELVLPRYFRNGSVEICDEIYEQIPRNSQTSKHQECRTCGCAKCNKQHHSNAETPPNTARTSSNRTNNSNDQQHFINTQRTEQRTKIKPHKCKKCSDHKICSKQKFKRIASEHKHMNTGSNNSSLTTKKSRIIKHLDKPKLNPVIENYIKRLLALNKQGLKAIEVVNQDCSGVNTPGSSVIGMPSNVNNDQPMVNKISLEQIKNTLKEQLLRNIEERRQTSKCTVKTTGSQTDRNLKPLFKAPRRRPVHKVKSLNISKHFIKTNRDNRRRSLQSTVLTASPVSVYSRKEKSSQVDSSIELCKPGIKKIPKQMKRTHEQSHYTSNSDSNNYCIPSQRKNYMKISQAATKIKANTKRFQSNAEEHYKPKSYTFRNRRATTTNSSESEATNTVLNPRELNTPPISISTQTNQVDSEVEFMKLAENKLQNMEKIADLTEKCTQRLSNLAKVLEEVRKNKSLAYSQMSTSDTTSESDKKSDKNVPVSENRLHILNPSFEIQTLTEALSSLPTSPHEEKKGDSNSNEKSSTFVPILMDLPKPQSFKTPSPVSFSTVSDTSDVTNTLQQPFVKSRGRPPPALSRINLKNAPDEFVIPHELSTVVEVDSPMSMKFKNHTTRPDNKHDASNMDSVEGKNLVSKDNTQSEFTNKDMSSNQISKLNTKTVDKSKSDSSDDSRIKMMDLKQFNEIMLKPFISLQDYAKQYNLDETDNGSFNHKISKKEPFIEDPNSLHSDASIPDVVAELLRRKLISEPFKFDTTSATVSSESALSMLALSRTHKAKKKSELSLVNKENLTETSESLSISSNPDLEQAFQKLGIGWASSTLKKTKERLALSSSSNTSSSSMPQFKIKSFNYQDGPEISKDSIMSLMNISKKEDISKLEENSKINETAKNALQQTSLTNSMTVKEFLANELAKKITFSNKSNRNATEDDFMSLCETRMPEEMWQLAHKTEDNEKSADSAPGGANTRARTSTPVQIFKSMTYHSTSSSNTSNGLFSNADDLSSVKITSNSNKNHSTSDKDDLTIPNYSLKTRKGLSDCSKSD